jgi:hypothetical protein
VVPGKNTQDVDRSGREWFVLVTVPPRLPAPAHSFVVPRNHLVAAVWIDHMNWLTMPGVPSGTRNASRKQARVQLSVFQAYEDQWHLLNEETQSTPRPLAGMDEGVIVGDGTATGSGGSHFWGRRAPEDRRSCCSTCQRQAFEARNGGRCPDLPATARAPRVLVGVCGPDWNVVLVGGIRLNG